MAPLSILVKPVQRTFDIPSPVHRPYSRHPVPARQSEWPKLLQSSSAKGHICTSGSQISRRENYIYLNWNLAMASRGKPCNTSEIPCYTNAKRTIITKRHQPQFTQPTQLPSISPSWCEAPNPRSGRVGFNLGSSLATKLRNVQAALFFIVEKT